MKLRIVAVADTPTANRISKKLTFQLNRQGESLEFTVNNTKAKIGGKLSYAAQTAGGLEIEVHQNFRVVATSRSGKQGFIEASKLGLGTTTLQAVVRKNDGSLRRSVPVDVTIIN